MAVTQGINHLGLTVLNLEATRAFFTELLGWEESGFDASYPRTAVSDGHTRLTLWQVQDTENFMRFDRKRNLGLHHLALTVASEAVLNNLYEKIQHYPEANIEFAPELVGKGPRKHMMCNEPGGLRIEFIWSGE
jgi:catechol 2,3-dioxygenase-like lactoylglutathione lyase family enzyme